MDRTKLINYFIRSRNYHRYLEIGVQDERSNFAHINCEYKVGVDIEPVSTFTGTSDDFFLQNREKFDLIFIDGLHTEEQVLKDINNAMQSLARAGIIILHDCMPPDEWHQREEHQFRPGEPWNGTVWRAALRVFNETEYRSTILNTDWGCGIIDTGKNQKPKLRKLPDQLSYHQHYHWLMDYKMEVSDFVVSYD
ncbi:MAG: class I SAM-dependent methyltransferase [Phaeodactylibacter sp.]|nr:class I SAM-dependent methyltransferase [Phaeodactylibacter sp.]MCB9299233.1 class I SAM-dependent methyltransferase [Lewinellaceae bacterium]